LPRRKQPEDEPEDDVEADDDADDDVDDDSDDESDDDDDADDDTSEDEESEPDEDDSSDESPEEERPRRRRRFSRSTPPSSMGRPSTGPARRAAARPTRLGHDEVLVEETKTELAPDISTWPGTAEAARQVGRHPSTIKLWRTQSRIRAVQDASGCWRHHPDDLAEAVDTPDATDPGSVLASGMSAIVQQGASANERLLAMTEIATEGLKDATGVLSGELKNAYVRIRELENDIAELRDKHAATHADDLKHERFIKKLELKHELDVSGSAETSVRLNGLLSILGPIAASIGARLLGRDAEADKVDAKMAGAPAPASGGAHAAAPVAPSTPSAETSTTAIATESDRDVPMETRIAAAMSRLCAAIRLLDKPAFAGLRAMLPPNVAAALDDIAQNESDNAVGRALAIIVQAAQNLSDLQFRALRPIAPQDVAAVLGELRELLRNVEVTPESPA
jgi:hypothetical protein